MPRVYLVFRNQLFGDAVRAILQTHPEIQLVGARAERDEVMQDVTALAPDIVLLEETDDGPAVHIADVMLSKPAPCRVITLRLNEDGMHVWSQTWRRTVRSQDLVEAIVTAGDEP